MPRPKPKADPKPTIDKVVNVEGEAHTVHIVVPTWARHKYEEFKTGQAHAVPPRVPVEAHLLRLPFCSASAGLES